MNFVVLAVGGAPVTLQPTHSWFFSVPCHVGVVRPSLPSLSLSLFSSLPNVSSVTVPSPPRLCGHLEGPEPRPYHSTSHFSCMLWACVRMSVTCMCVLVYVCLQMVVCSTTLHHQYRNFSGSMRYYTAPPVQEC